MQFLLILQPPYSLLVGIDTYFDKEITKLDYSSLVIHLLFVSIEFRWDYDEEVL